MAVNARDIEVDFAEDEAMDYTSYGDSTVGGIMTDAADDDADCSQGDGLDDDDDDEALTKDDGEISDMPFLVAMEPKRATFAPT
jgi:hypothetical protein